MTTHERYLQAAAVAIDFGQSESEQRRLDDHLAGCPECRARVAALQGDASAIAAMQQIHLDPVRAERILDQALARHVRPPLGRLVLLAAVLVLSILAALAIAIGASILRDSQRPSLVDVPPSAAPSPGASAAASGSPTSTDGVGTWTVSKLADAATSLDTDAIAIAESGGRLVAVGGPGCTAGSDGSGGCWAQVRWSDDGRTWTKVVDDTELSVGRLVATSGPGPGMVDVAGGPAGFLAIGYAGDQQAHVATWMSPDGKAWRQIDPGSAFAQARIRAVTASGDGWVVVGAVDEAGGPRGAIWTSADGRSWTRIADSALFDVGGLLDRSEQPGAQGPIDVVAAGDVVVAVGASCDASGGGCRPTVWRSADGGATWAKATGPDVEGDLSLVVAGSDGFTAFGQLCKDGPPCMPMVARSSDGGTWTGTAAGPLPGEAIVRAAVAVDGGIVAAAPARNTLILMATHDGSTWGVISYDSFAPTPDATIPPDYATIGGLGMTRTADGAAIVVGSVTILEATTPTLIVVEDAPH